MLSVHTIAKKTCGVAAMLPTILLVLFVWRREMMRQTTAHHSGNPSPPVVVVTPQALPGYGAQQPGYNYGNPNAAWQWSGAQQPERTFTMVGGEE